MMIFEKISQLFYKKKSGFKPFIGSKKLDVLIFDDLFPNPISGFRYHEFRSILNRFSNSRILVDPTSYQAFNLSEINHSKDIAIFYKKFPTLNKKIFIANEKLNVNTKLFYCIFLNNIYSNIEWLEKFKIPFVFTLYPGGGFGFHNSLSDLKLERVLNSPQLKKVIVNQSSTKEYLLNRKLSEDKIAYIFGIPVSQSNYYCKINDKKEYLRDKDSFDVCFCGAKYMEKGVDKGYDIFIEVAKRLIGESNKFRFHVIGGFNSNDINIDELKDKITFYGYLNSEDLKKIFEINDIIISPNRPFLLAQGAFDGFPLGTVVTAVLNGVVAILTDHLNQNSSFIDGEELIITNGSVEDIVREVLRLKTNPEILHSVSRAGRRKFSKVYSDEYQIKSRLDIISNEIEQK